MQRSILFLGLFLALFIGCKEEAKVNPSAARMKAVMAIHDEVMPKMGQMGSLVGELNSKEDSTEIGLKYRDARIALQDAHKNMMDWMQNFGNRFTPDEILKGAELSEQKLKWLDEEETSVQKVAEDINTSIANAKALLGKE